MTAIQIHPEDNVAVALSALERGCALPNGARTLEAVAAGHKIALRAIAPGQPVIKYGCPIGHTLADIQEGAWVHVHNMATNLSEKNEYTYEPVVYPSMPETPETFWGYLRPDGQAAVRNELWILPLVGCVNSVAQALVRESAHLISGTVDGLYAFTHPYGCSQMGDDHAQTRRLLASLARHPNAGGVLILALGCENLTVEQFQAELSGADLSNVRILVCQQTDDEMAEGARLLAELAAYAGRFSRQPLPASKLVIGMKCGGSDGLSGVTANPAVGAFSDRLIAQGGTTVLTEVPEMFGAEGLLFNRCADVNVFRKAVSMVGDFKEYFVRHGQTVYENPSPGNKEGGISTLEDKSCGCVQKGGRAAVTDVIAYGERVTVPGLNLLSGPGNDLVSATALTAAGAHLILFTTGRGTPFGAPAPTMKISTNTDLFERKRAWIDFDAGPVARGETAAGAGERLFACVLSMASGERTKSEVNGFRELSIWKGGVTL